MTYRHYNPDNGQIYEFPSEFAFKAAVDWFLEHSAHDVIRFCKARGLNIDDPYVEQNLVDDWADQARALWARVTFTKEADVALYKLKRTHSTVDRARKVIADVVKAVDQTTPMGADTCLALGLTFGHIDQFCGLLGRDIDAAEKAAKRPA